MLNLIRSEPVLLQGFVQAAVTMIMAFGLHLAAEQIAAINIFTAALLSILTRQAVIPVGNASTAKTPAP